MMSMILNFLLIFQFQFPSFHIENLIKSNIIPETNTINYVLISMDDIGLYQTRYKPQIFNIWTTIIKSAHRQNITVISYLVEKRDNLALIKTRLQNERIDTNQIRFIADYKTNTIWMRDYGPVLYRNNGHQNDSGNAMRVMDFSYLYSRPLDDAAPRHFATIFKLPYATSRLRIEGGNILTTASGSCIISDKVSRYNSDNLIRLELEKIGCQKIIIVKSLKYDKTQHVDMWLYVLNSNTLIMGQYTRAQDFEDYHILKDNFEYLTSLGFTILPIPMPSHCINGKYDCEPHEFVSRSYMNVLQLNNEIIIPVYNVDRVHEQEALDKWKEYTGKTIIPVEAETIIREHGAVHCMSKTF